MIFSIAFATVFIAIAFLFFIVIRVIMKHNHDFVMAAKQVASLQEEMAKQLLRQEEMKKMYDDMYTLHNREWKRVTELEAEVIELKRTISSLTTEVVAVRREDSQSFWSALFNRKQ